MPQPEWFADLSVVAQEDVAGSTLELYRDALRLRRELITDETLRWEGAEDDEILHFIRGQGGHSVTNFGITPIDLPRGEVLLTSAALERGQLPGDSTAWVLA